MPFAELTLLGPKNHVLDWGPDPPVRRGILEVVRPIEKHGALLFVAPSRIRGLFLTIYTSYDVFPHNEVPLTVFYRGAVCIMCCRY